MIVEVFKEWVYQSIICEYGIAKSTISSFIKDVKEIKVDENEVMTLNEVKALKKKWQELKRKMKYYTKGGL